MNCPKCKATMEAVTFESITIDRCTSCRGLFFDRLEAEKLRALPGSESLDIGPEELGRAQNTNDRIHCPRDTSLMVRIVEPKQPHIWLETCAVCQGTFFDAGEFRDWKNETLVDLLKGFFVKPRM